MTEQPLSQTWLVTLQPPDPTHYLTLCGRSVYLQFLELQSQVNEPDHSIPLLLRVLREVQDGLLAALDGLA